ncbi:hypothetical protein [Bacillus wiedmannii]|uniref:Uncharacterized protein n=1 Tax=Bacillus wiedmannii TaxID=1890302 RepID=A0A2B5XER1_9BACI|nr:hypothetical protein [Bacillus wiedmannii]PEM50735.1 hypothetical protein CN611_22540 [Bacillus wiedmannii]PGA94789.1 hypothetical protein COL92_24050 [Bacillus wiedmannii]
MTITISDLENKLKEATINNRVVITDLPFLSSEVQQMLLKINNDTRIIVKSSQVTRQEEEVILKGEVTIIDFTLPDVTFHFKIAEEKVELFTQISVAQSIPISLGVTKFNLNDVVIEINTQSNEKQKAILSGNIKLEEQTINLTRDLLGEKIFNGNIPTFSLKNLLSILCRTSVEIPGFSDVTIQDAHININFSSKSTPINLWANVNNFGRLHLLTQKYEDSWEYIGIFSLPDEWRLSSISNVFSIFDQLIFKNPKLTVSSVTDPRVSILNEDSQTTTISVVEGLYFSGILQMEGLGLELIRGLFNISEIPIGGLIGQNLAETKFETKFDQTLTVFGINFNDAGIILQVEPFIVGFQLSTIVQIQRDQLPFSGGIQLQQTGASYSLAMRGIWENPFGLPMLDIENVLLQFQTNPDPKLAVAGDISFGDDLRVSVICQFTSSGVPDMLRGQLDGELSISRLIKVFTGISIPEGFLDVFISNVLVYIVANPLGALIDGTQYPFGFRVHGLMHAYGIEATSQVSIEENGISLDGQMAPIIVGDILKIYGATTEQGPKLIYRATVEQPFLFQLDAGIQVLGATLNTHILVKQDGFEFSFSAKIFNAFEASIVAQGTGELNQGNFYIRASMHNDMIEYVNTQTRKILQETASTADSRVSQAQTEISNLEQQLTSLNEQLTGRETEISNAKSVAENALQQAKNVENKCGEALQHLQNAKDELEGQLQNAKQSLDDTIKRLEKELRRLITNPGRIFDLRQLIDRTKDLISDLKNKISEAAVAITRATSELEDAVRAVAEAGEHLKNILPPELDPIYLSIKAAIEAAKLSLATLRTELEILKVVAGKSVQIVTFIQSNGIDSLFDVSKISFEGNIQSVGSGQVSLSMDISFMNTTQTIAIDFNFQDQISGVKNLANKLIESLT